MGVADVDREGDTEVVAVLEAEAPRVIETETDGELDRVVDGVMEAD